jgi:hypothetical protein
MSNSLLATMASLNLQNIPLTSALAEPSENWLTFDQISHAALDSTVKEVYRAQLRELWGLVANAIERSVEQFVLMEEFEAITGDFSDVAAEAKRERVEKEKVMVVEKGRMKEVMKVEAEAESEGAGVAVMWTWKGGESAQKWRQFRSGDGKV